MSEPSLPSLRSAVPEVLGTPPEMLYHYTTREGLLGILKSRAVWATSIRHLNDTSEFLYALDVLRGVVEERLGAGPTDTERDLLQRFVRVADIPELGVVGYVFSMSEDSDVLSQWRAYGRPSNAYALGFDASSLRRLLEPRGYFLAPCRYDQELQQALIARVIDAAFEEYKKREGRDDIAPDLNRRGTSVFFGLLMLQAATPIKSPAFREEREWRLVRTGPETSLSFRPGPSMLVPYQEVLLATDPDALPFRRIVIGPSPHAAEDEAAAHLLSHHLPTSDLDIARSEIPFRA